MGYADLTKRFKGVRDQHNVMAIVGNGFDIQALSDLESPTDTRYESFFHYLKYRHFNSENLLLAKMDDLRSSGAENWSDVEAAIGKLITDDGVPPRRVTEDLSELQAEFSNFLDGVATPEILAQLGTLSVENKWTMTSFTQFLGDIQDADEYHMMGLPPRLDIGDLFNFRFINLNYTTLLDDFVYLDQIQFDPRPFKGSDRNMHFRPNPREHPGSKDRRGFHMVSYLVSDVVHPHGNQYVPRSLLFGIDSASESAVKLTKPYWAQNEVKYGDLFADTHLFIIFGCSLGETDGWWWRNIAKTLAEYDDVDLLLYWRMGPHDGRTTSADVRAKFAEAVGDDVVDDLPAVLEDKVRVVLYDDSTPRAWLNTNPATAPTWIAKSS